MCEDTHTKPAATLYDKSRGASFKSEWVLGTGQLFVKYVKYNGAVAYRHVCPDCGYFTSNMPNSLVDLDDIAMTFDARTEPSWKWWVERKIRERNRV